VSYVFKTTPQVFEMRLSATQPEDFHWMEVSSVYEHCEGKVIMDSSFLKTLNVNPKTFFEKDACTPYEWSHVVLWQGIMVMTFQDIQTKAFGIASTMTPHLRLCGQV
jgi:hypothetical protein